MSWLFGLNKTPSGGVPLEAPQVPVMGGEGGAGGSSGSGGVGGDDPNKKGGSSPEGYRSEAYSFDSTALERAAKAAKVNIE